MFHSVCTFEETKGGTARLYFSYFCKEAKKVRISRPDKLRLDILGDFFQVQGIATRHTPFEPSRGRWIGPKTSNLPNSAEEIYPSFAEHNHKKLSLQEIIW